MRYSMNERKLEEELKAKAEKIKLEEFSSRFEKLQQREKAQQFLERETVCETVPALENGNKTCKTRRKLNKPLIIFMTFALLCILVLAIVLPLTLNKKLPMGYGKGEASLYEKVSNEEEFYRELQFAGIAVPDLSECDVDVYGLIFLATTDAVKGGYVDYYDERNNSSVALEIFTTDVKVEIGTHDFDNQCKTVAIKDTTVRYLIIESDEEGAYRMLALANNKNNNYKLEILSDNENILSVFESLFV